eukprot:1160483-Pelagomonas_calceolata.AAC.6
MSYVLGLHGSGRAEKDSDLKTCSSGLSQETSQKTDGHSHNLLSGFLVELLHEHSLHELWVHSALGLLHDLPVEEARATTQEKSIDEAGWRKGLQQDTRGHGAPPKAPLTTT